MLIDLLKAADVPLFSTVFELDGTRYGLDPLLLVTDTPVLIPSYQSKYLFILAAWTTGGRRTVFDVEFGFVGPSEAQQLVMIYRDMRTPSMRNGTPLTGLLNAIDNKRIINRWKATELLK